MEAILRAFLGKKYDIIEVLVANAGESGICHLTIAQVCELAKASKPTVIACFKELESKGVLKRLGNGCYEIAKK